ncbi:MAG: hypothetical protein JRD89_00855 [Deltaproteobacteria bacterium]|nr:hypothetical protein [Deltaproteobacteria bacterium]
MARIEETKIDDETTVIRIVLGPKDDRVCDVCNDLLIQWSDEEERLVAVKRCYATYYGLVCQKCFDRMLKGAQKHNEPIEVYAGWSEGEAYNWPY